MDPIIIRCRENGPYVLPAAMCKLVDHLGNELPLPAGKDTIALCRCGASQSKPFCDGSHKRVGFVGQAVMVGGAGDKPATQEAPPAP